MDCCNHQCEACHKHKERTPEEMKALINRLNRIEGQVRGIRGMSSLDIALAREFGYRIKLIAQVRERREPGQPDDKVRLEAGVFPALVPYTVLLARVGGVYKNKKIAVYRGTDCIYSRKRPVLAPGEMETVRLKAELLRGPGDAVTVTLEEG